MYVVPQLLSQCTSIGIPSELCNDGYPDALGSTIAEFISLCEGNNINFVDCGDMQGFTGGLCRDGNTACTSDAFTTTVIDSTGSEVTTQHFGADPGLCATLQADCLSIVGNFESLSQQVGGCPYFGVNYVNGVPSTPEASPCC
jgi:hypothetical protein